MLYPSLLTARSLLGLMDSQLCVAECSTDGMLLSANAHFLAACGRRAEDVIGKPFHDICRPFRERREYGASARHSEKTEKFELLRDSEKPLPFWAFAIPVHDATGGTVKLIYTGFTDQKGMKDVASELPQSLVIEAMNRSLLIAEYSAQGIITSINDLMLSVLGFTSGEMTGKTPESFFADNKNADREETWQQLSAGHVHSELRAWRTAMGTTVWLESMFTPVVDERGKVLKVIQFASDVSERTINDRRQYSLARLLASVTDGTRNAVYITDASGKTAYVNQSFTKMTGYSRRDIMGKTPGRIFGPQEIKYRQHMRELFASRKNCSFEALVYGRKGKRLFVSALANRIQTLDGQTFVAVVMTDITDAKLHEQLHYKALAALANETPYMEVIALLCEEVEHILPDMFATVTGVTRNGGLHTIAAPSSPVRPDWNVLPDGEDSTPTSKSIRTGKVVVENDLATSAYPVIVKEQFSRSGIAACFATPVKSGSHATLGAVTFYFSEHVEPDRLHQRMAAVMSRLCALAMEREESRKTVRLLKFYDPVTKLPTRELFKANIEQLLGSSDVTRLAILVLDVDRFDRFNKAYGHDAGNKILRTVAARILRNRQGGMLPGRGNLDEFVIALPESTPANAMLMAKLLQKQIGESCRINGVDIFLEASVGISMYPDNSTMIDELIDQAGMALSLKNGNGDVRFFSDEMNDLTSRDISLEASLRAAILREELHLHYQPQINLKTGGLYGVEALCRWTDPERGSIPPTRFIPLAESAGLIESLSEWVWKEACTQLGDWRKKGLPVPAVSVNLSSSSFQDTDLPERIRKYVNKQGLAPRDIVLELTESVLLDSTPATRLTIDKAHDMGFALSLDDFGTGYSSLSYLKDLPISEIKLDRSFVQDIDTDETSRRISQAIRYIGTSLKLSVLAEGIETKTQCERIRQLRYHAAQGYLFSKPVSPLELEQWMRA